MYRFAYWDGRDKNIKLFTWNKDGDRIMVDRPYSPYLYIEDSNGKYTSIFGTPLSKKIFKNSWERSEFIKDSKITRLFENFKPAQQFLMDEYGGMQDSEDFSKNPLKICFFDIETEPLPYNEFPAPEEARAPISLITIHDSLTNEYTTFGTKEFTGELPNDLKVFYIHCEDEYELLESFLRYIEKDHPDILSAWNSNFFDMPYLVNRITKVLGQDELKRLSPLGIFNMGIGKTKDNPPREYTKYITPGMLIIDYIDVYKKLKVKLQDSYKLDHIGSIEVGEQKLEYEGPIGDFQKNNWNDFVLYNIRDVELLVKIDKKTNYFALLRYLATLGLTNFEDGLGVVAYVSGAIALKARSRGQILFTPKREVLEGKNEGGYVSVKPGLVKDLITYDAASLYPSCAITNNISIETMVGEFVELGDGNIHLTLTSGKQYTLTEQKFNEFVKNTELIRTPANVLFSQKKQGIYPEFMESVFDSRKKDRKEIVRLEEELKKDLPKEEKEKIELKIKQLQIAQYTKKLCINSCYGALTSKTSPLGHDSIGNSITLTGQCTIKQVNRIVKDFIMMKTPGMTEEVAEEHIIFNDTDSVGVSLHGVAGIIICKDSKVTPEGYKLIDELNDYIDRELNKFVTETFNTKRTILHFKREKICDYGLYRKKKNYVLHCVDNEGEVDLEGNLKISWKYTGVELAKSIMSKPIKEIGKKVIEPMILHQNKYETDKRLREAYEEFKKLPLTTICKIARVKTFNKYSDSSSGFQTMKGMQAHIRAAYYYNLIIEKEKIHGVQPIREGDTIQVIALKPNNKYRIDSIAIRDGYMPPEFLELFEIDYRRIFEKPFYACIASLYKVANWTPPNVTDEYEFELFDLFGEE